MRYFSEVRNLELSLMDYLVSKFTTDWTGVTVVKTFNDVYASTINLPVVCVRLAQTNSTRLEVGTDTLWNNYLIIIDVFCRSDAQRLDLSYYIKEQIKLGWVHYDYSHKSGDNTTLEKSANGTDYISKFLSDAKVEIGSSSDEKDKYRQTISFTVRKNI